MWACSSLSNFNYVEWVSIINFFSQACEGGVYKTLGNVFFLRIFKLRLDKIKHAYNTSHV